MGATFKAPLEKRSRFSAAEDVKDNTSTTTDRQVYRSVSGSRGKSWNSDPSQPFPVQPRGKCASAVAPRLLFSVSFRQRNPIGGRSAKNNRGHRRGTRHRDVCGNGRFCQLVRLRAQAASANRADDRDDLSRVTTSDSRLNQHNAESEGSMAEKRAEATSDRQESQARQQDQANREQ